uniref:Putative ovule protein n=1 Tax=Solanum chacoense TaxID=4108 RepID=A0A0V0GLK9_SOLCH
MRCLHLAIHNQEIEKASIDAFGCTHCRFFLEIISTSDTFRAPSDFHTIFHLSCSPVVIVHPHIIVPKYCLICPALPQFQSGLPERS